MTTKSDALARLEGEFEYSTYAPAGQMCPTCKRPIQSLELVRRMICERQSGPSAVVHVHAGECPG